MPEFKTREEYEAWKAKKLQPKATQQETPQLTPFEQSELELRNKLERERLNGSPKSENKPKASNGPSTLIVLIVLVSIIFIVDHFMNSPTKQASSQAGENNSNDFLNCHSQSLLKLVEQNNVRYFGPGYMRNIITDSTGKRACSCRADYYPTNTEVSGNVVHFRYSVELTDEGKPILTMNKI
jgi:hypothetical protein